jgi:hypothetical protein
MTVGIIWRDGVFFGTGVAATGSIGVTTLHNRGPGYLELPPTAEAAPSSLEDSMRAVCKDGDLLCTILMNMALESHS